MQLRQRRLKGFYDVMAPRHVDNRGFLFKPYEITAFQEAGWTKGWEQVIQSHTDSANTMRGIYVQAPPFTEGKLVACTRGEMWWMVVDLRQGSETFGQWDGAHLRPGDTLLIERGFAHGCLSLTDDVDLLLLADNVHTNAEYAGIAWNDPDLSVAWPLLAPQPIISEAHAAYPPFAQFRATYGAIAVS